MGVVEVVGVQSAIAGKCAQGAPASCKYKEIPLGKTKY